MKQFEPGMGINYADDTANTGSVTSDSAIETRTEPELKVPNPNDEYDEVAAEVKAVWRQAVNRVAQLQQSWAPDFQNFLNEIADAKSGDTEDSQEHTDSYERVSELLNRRGIDLEEFITRDVQGKDADAQHETLLWLVLKDDSYEHPYYMTEAEFVGFEKDSDFANLSENINKCFTPELLQKCFISRVKYHPEFVLAIDNFYPNYLTKKQYENQVAVDPTLSKRRIRAANVTSLQKDDRMTPVVVPTSINLYNFDYEDLSQYDYLEGKEESEKMPIFKFGTVSHEIAHNIYNNVLTLKDIKEFSKAVDEVGHGLTAYSRKYVDGTHGQSVEYSEEFAEAIRLFITAPEYLETNYPKIALFIRKKFPEIKPL